MNEVWVDFTKCEVSIDVAVGEDRTSISFWRRRNKGMSVGDLAELLQVYDWGQQLDILAYMKKFQTWGALYDDLDRRMADSKSGIRNVTPPKPKQLEEKK